MRARASACCCSTGGPALVGLVSSCRSRSSRRVVVLAPARHDAQRHDRRRPGARASPSVVDDAVVGTERVLRRLREPGDAAPPSGRRQPRSSRRLLEARGALLCSGADHRRGARRRSVRRTGRRATFLPPIALAYVVAVVGLDGRRPDRHPGADRAPAVPSAAPPAVSPPVAPTAPATATSARLGRIVRASLRRARRVRRRSSLAVSCSSAFTSQSLIPTFRDRNLLIQWDGPSGTVAPEMDRITAQARPTSFGRCPGSPTSAAMSGGP